MFSVEKFLKIKLMLKEFEKEFVSRDKGGVPEWNLKYKDKSPSYIILSIKKFLDGYDR